MKVNSERVNISNLRLHRKLYNLDPPYQRETGVWSEEKKQLFVDTIVNGYDVPKIYIHRLSKPDATGFHYAVIDGKQRLTAIWDFMDGRFPLGDEFEFKLDVAHLESGKERINPKPGNYFTDFPDPLQELLKNTSLDLVFIEDCEEEDIDEQFSRLNNGEPLNTAEKRNAMGGNMVKIIREVATQSFFKENVKFKNKRYAYQGVAAKLVRLEEAGIREKTDLVDLSKKHLDHLVQSNKQYPEKDRKKLLNHIKANLKKMGKIFGKNDPLLNKQTYPQIYYVFVKRMLKQFTAVEGENIYTIIKTFLAGFEKTRIEKAHAESDERDNEDFVQFTLYAQQGTDSLNGMKERLGVLERYFLKWNVDKLLVKDPKRNFSHEERYYIWRQAEMQCQKCKAEVEFEQMDADHIERWSKGGKTKLSNARCLCVSCNRGNDI